MYMYTYLYATKQECALKINKKKHTRQEHLGTTMKSKAKSDRGPTRGVPASSPAHLTWRVDLRSPAQLPFHVHSFASPPREGSSRRRRRRHTHRSVHRTPPYTEADTSLEYRPRARVL